MYALAGNTCHNSTAKRREDITCMIFSSHGYCILYMDSMKALGPLRQWL